MTNWDFGEVVWDQMWYLAWDQGLNQVWEWHLMWLSMGGQVKMQVRSPIRNDLKEICNERSSSPRGDA